MVVEWKRGNKRFFCHSILSPRVSIIFIYILRKIARIFRQTVYGVAPIEINHENPFNDNTTDSIFFPNVAQTFLTIKFCIKIPLPCSIFALTTYFLFRTTVSRGQIFELTNNPGRNRCVTTDGLNSEFQPSFCTNGNFHEGNVPRDVGRFNLDASSDFASVSFLVSFHRPPRGRGGDATNLAEQINGK